MHCTNQHSWSTSSSPCNNQTHTSKGCLSASFAHTLTSALLSCSPHSPHTPGLPLLPALPAAASLQKNNIPTSLGLCSSRGPSHTADTWLQSWCAHILRAQQPCAGQGLPGTLLTGMSESLAVIVMPLQGKCRAKRNKTKQTPK